MTQQNRPAAPGRAGQGEAGKEGCTGMFPLRKEETQFGKDALFADRESWRAGRIFHCHQGQGHEMPPWVTCFLPGTERPANLFAQ